MEKLNIGVIGVGFMGAIHTRVFSELSNAQVLAIADVDFDRAKEVAEKYGVKNFFLDYNELLSIDEIQAVIIATPEFLHREPCVAAARAKKHILLEKPIATELKDANIIIQEAKKSNVKLMIGHLLRFDPRYVGVKEAIEEGTIGRPMVVYTRRNGTFQEALRLAGRITVEEYIATHDIDQIIWYFNDEVVRVWAETVDGPVKKKLGVHDYCWINLRFKEGGLGVVEVGWSLNEKWASWKSPSEWHGFGHVQMEVIGTKGSIYIDYLPMGMYACDEKEGWKFPETLYWPSMYGRLTGNIKEQASHFVECVLEDKEPLATGKDARKALEVIVAAKRSYSERKPVQI